jgi:HAE1 family hydrophobic/amphiphilic exporter-1
MVGRIIDHVEDGYRRLISWALENRKKVTFLTLSAFILTAASIPFAGVEFIPSMDVGLVSVSIKMPNGTLLDQTVGMIDRVNDAISGLPRWSRASRLSAPPA